MSTFGIVDKAFDNNEREEKKKAGPQVALRVKRDFHCYGIMAGLTDGMKFQLCRLEKEVDFSL